MIYKGKNKNIEPVLCFSPFDRVRVYTTAHIAFVYTGVMLPHVVKRRKLSLTMLPHSFSEHMTPSLHVFNYTKMEATF